MIQATRTQPSCHDDARINGGGATALAKKPQVTLAAKSTSPISPNHSPQPRRNFPDVCYELRHKIDTFLAEQIDDKVLRGVQSQVSVSMEVIEEALRRYGPGHLSLSYNGGKDCLVLLILILACLPAWTPPTPPPSSDANAPPPTTQSSDEAPSSSSNDLLPSEPEGHKPLQAIYIISPDPFVEVEEFVAQSAEQYNLDLVRFELPMRPALEAYLAQKPAVKAIFLGTRRTDPHGEFLTHFDPTDHGWPQFMRVHPVIDWHYVEIWAFIRHLDIPFCDLYNQGFTSLGGVTDTRPNPALAVGGDQPKFRPAYELRDDDEERLGRDR
ncbi:hypothetical protein B0T17DRAFT_484371 [Bombardia bombarda]|uniref:FAD synthase n=1 Tax=Bombardia bombarda TaxID=252184 RepID=A0AA39XPM8_9PEZI|nr:hypothetical protein B0T17DRAFT_484371 [Bombardia bombarda]